MSTAHDVYHAYVRESATAGHRPRISISHPVFAELAAWCSAAGVDAVRYVRARFEATRWAHKIAPEALASPKFMAKFRAFGEDRQASEIGQDGLAERVLTDTSRWGAEVTLLAESVKRALVDNRVACAADPVTAGWNPRSSWCAGCDNASACRAALAGRYPEVERARSGR